MSIESLVIVALLIVFPLLERLSRYLRARAAQIPAAPVGASPRQHPPALPRLPKPEREADAPGATGSAVSPVSAPPPVLAPPALPPRHPAAERLTAAERLRAGRVIQAGQAAREPGRGASARAPYAVALRSGRADLRRAVVLMAVLGPCKALEAESRRH
ncbi:MAG: hypothetical protein KA371_17185 [Acidobacteria bacterium]|nr:hypothetical protein [Acidobacteriota bacterium]